MKRSPSELAQLATETAARHRKRAVLAESPELARLAKSVAVAAELSLTVEVNGLQAHLDAALATVQAEIDRRAAK